MHDTTQVHDTNYKQWIKLKQKVALAIDPATAILFVFSSTLYSEMLLKFYKEMQLHGPANEMYSKAKNITDWPNKVRFTNFMLSKDIIRHNTRQHKIWYNYKNLMNI